MYSRLILRIFLLFLIMNQGIPAGFSDDFPGKGDRGAWSSALPYYNRANKYLEHGRIEEAIQDYEEAIFRYEYDPDFYVNYGVALRKRENYKGAEEIFKKAIELRANDWQAWSNLANSYLKQDKLKETIESFEKAMKVQPPPPQSEKAAMLKDIEDINKILSMRAKAPGKQSKASTARAASTKNTTTKQAAKTETSRTAGRLAKTNGTAPDIERREKILQHEQTHGLKESGWDWVK